MVEMAIDTGYRLALLGVLPGDLDETYDVGRWTRPVDMPTALDWLIQGDSDLYERHESLVEAFDYSLGGFGQGSFTWLITMTPGMIAQFRQAYLGAVSGDPLSGNESAEVIVRTYDATYGDGWLILSATMHFPRAQNMNRFGTIWTLPLRFVNAQLAAGGFSSGFSYGFS